VPTVDVMMNKLRMVIESYPKDENVRKITETLYFACSQDAAFFTERVMVHGVPTDEDKASPLGALKLSGAMPNKRPIKCVFTFLLNVINKNFKAEPIYFLLAADGCY